jgi:hypothetical protein
MLLPNECIRFAYSIQSAFVDTMIYLFYCNQHFKLKLKNSEELLVPGLSAVAVIAYTARDETEKSDQLVVGIDGNVVKVPITA